jgi:hypothetical protein
LIAARRRSYRPGNKTIGKSGDIKYFWGWSIFIHRYFI